MPDSMSPFIFKCPNCGATLSLDDPAATSLNCSFCNTAIVVVNRAGAAAPGSPPPVARPAAPPPVQPVYVPPPQITSARASGSGGACLLRLGLAFVILLIMAGVGVFVFLRAGLPGLAGLANVAATVIPVEAPSISSPAVLIPGAGENPDVLSTLSHYDENASATVYNVGRLSTQTGQPLWKSADLPKGVYGPDALFADAARGYAVVGSHLTAYTLADGKVAWEAELPDKLWGGCSSTTTVCATVQGTWVVVVTTDDTLQVFDAATGKPAWNRRLEQYSVQDGLLLNGDQVLVRAPEAKGNTWSLLFLDLKTGAEKMKITSPAMYRDAGVYFNADHTAVYLVYQGMEKWQIDGAAPKRVWQLSNKDYTYNLKAENSLMTDDTFYTQLQSSDTPGLLAVSLADGQAQTLPGNADYELQPLAAQNGLLLVQARRTRGSTRYELWGLGAATGEQRWQIILGDSQQLADTSGLISDTTEAWLWRLAAQTLTLVRFQANPNQVTVDTYALETGEKSHTATVPVQAASDFYSVPKLLGWQGHAAWLEVEGHLYALDVDKGKMVFPAP